tara:strand:- start:2757 stop:3518 length:762 start_codon:yes stop_codon:yes gene_type:complete
MGIFFQSKHKILPLLNGMIDIHNHVLPGIDDGASTLSDSIHMLKEYDRLGITGVVASPHVMESTYPNTPTTIQDALGTLKAALVKEQLNVTLQGAAAEYMLDTTFKQLLCEDTILPITTKHLLVEMSYLQPPLNIEEHIFTIKHKGYTPILAHPERYTFLQKDTDYQQFIDLGCMFQLNLLSLTSHYGTHVQKKAFTLLKNGQYQFVGTDAHHTNHLQKIGQIKVTKKQYTQLAQLIANTTSLFDSSLKDTRV